MKFFYRKIRTFFDIEDLECPDFMIFDATVPSQCYRYKKKKHFATFDFFCENEACVNCVGLNVTK